MGTPHEKDNVRDPDPFDGSDPNKLRAFFAQLELVFKARPRTFDSDERKVTYALSYLKGTALQWFEPYLLEGYSEEPPLFLYSYEAFQDELRINFGPYDATGAAEHDLENLRMTEGQRIAKYITQFNRLATQVRWGTAALRYQFYKGLPDRLKDRISEVGKPETLEGLRNLAQSLDHRYWERKAEQSRDHNKSGKSANKPERSDNKPPTPQKSSAPSGLQPPSSSKPTPSGNNSARTSKEKKPYSDKLGKDGKLTQEERQRRFANNLCLFCGGPGHTAGACPKKTSSAAKARAAQATPDATPTEPAKAPEETKN